MSRTLSRLFGFILIITGLVGIAISSVGLTTLWRNKARMTERIHADLELTINALEATAEGLRIADQSLETAAVNITTMESTLTTVAESLAETPELLDAISDLISNDLPDTIGATQASLEAAQSSAEIIENVLIILTSIPFLPGDPYEPEVPLHVSLGEVSTSLDAMFWRWRAISRKSMSS